MIESIALVSRKRLRGRNLILDVSAQSDGFVWMVTKVSTGQVLAKGCADDEAAARTGAEQAAKKYLDRSPVDEGGWYSVVH